jgi:hypothetical protein
MKNDGSVVQHLPAGSIILGEFRVLRYRDGVRIELPCGKVARFTDRWLYGHTLEEFYQVLLDNNKDSNHQNAIEYIFYNWEVGREILHPEGEGVIARVVDFNNIWTANIKTPDGRYYAVLIDEIPEDMNYTDFRLWLARALRVEAPKLQDYLVDEFTQKLLYQLDEDEKRWGDEWRRRDIDIDVRVHNRIEEYFENCAISGDPIPWLKIAGLALIAQARLDHPEWLVG